MVYFFKHLRSRKTTEDPHDGSQAVKEDDANQAVEEDDVNQAVEENDANQVVEQDSGQITENELHAPDDSIEWLNPELEQETVTRLSPPSARLSGAMDIDLESELQPPTLGDDYVVPPSPKTTLLAKFQYGSDHEGDDPNDSSDYEKLKLRLQTLEEKIKAMHSRRMNVLELRDKCRQKRTRLALQREDQTKLTQELLRLCYVGVVDREMLDYQQIGNLLESNIKASEDLKTMEWEYEEMERDVDREEWLLKEEEAVTFQGGNNIEANDMLNADSTANVTEGESSSESSSDHPERSAKVNEISVRLARNQSLAMQVWEELCELDRERAHTLEKERQLPDRDRPEEYRASYIVEDIDKKYSELQLELKELQQTIFVDEDKLADLTDLLSTEGQFPRALASSDQAEVPDNSDLLSIDGERDGNAIEKRHLPPYQEMKDEYQNIVETRMDDLRPDHSTGMGIILSYWFQLCLVSSHMQMLVFRNSNEAYTDEMISSDRQLFRIIVDVWTNENHVPPVNYVPTSPRVRRVASRRSMSPVTSRASEENNPDLDRRNLDDARDETFFPENNDIQDSPAFPNNDEMEL